VWGLFISYQDLSRLFRNYHMAATLIDVGCTKFFFKVQLNKIINGIFYLYFMGLSVGIVGLPNVGKSTLFQTITKRQVDIANYPFCTIEPNTGVVAVEDERVDKLASCCHSAKKIYTTIEFVDIAGLVKGANQGEGLGNKFLANIRETDAIVYILRAFKNPEIVNTANSIDPMSEKNILDTELSLKDAETITKRIESLGHDIKRGEKESIKENDVLKKALDFLDKGKILSEQKLEPEEKKILDKYQLLTIKPRIYLLNGKDSEVDQEVKESFKKNNWPYLIIDLRNEFDLIDLTLREREELGITSLPELDLLIKKAYEILGLITFLTSGPDETRAWTLRKGETAQKAGGVIHSDFEKYFICAEVIRWEDLLDCGGFKEARVKGSIRTEGKEYLVKDGDVIEIKAGV